MNLAHGEKLLTGWLPGLASLSLVAWMAFQSAELTWGLIPGGDEASRPLAPATSVEKPAATAEGARTGDMAERIAHHHLFGKRPVAEQPGPAVVDAPETQLNLTLRGVLVSTETDSGLALIARGRGAEKLYAVGESIPGGATLERVESDKVILRRAGQFETLKLPNQTLDTTTRTTSPATANRPDPAMLKRLRRQALRNPASLAQKFRAYPARQNGKLVGYRLKDLQDSGALAAMGLQADDVIMSVNGQKLAQVPNPGVLYRGLKEAETFNVRILRNGTEIPLTLSLR